MLYTKTFFQSFQGVGVTSHRCHHSPLEYTKENLGTGASEIIGESGLDGSFSTDWPFRVSLKV